MANYVASRWKRDLTHFIGCCWVAQIGSLDRDEWHVAIHKFLAVMAKRKASEWTDIKELMPLQFMPYVAKLFREVTGQDLQGLSRFTGWIGQGGYYHCRVAQQDLIHLIPHLQRQPMPRTPDARPSGRPLPPRLAQIGTPAMGASGKRPDRTQQPPVEADRDPPQTRVHSRPPLARTESLLPLAMAESLLPPARMESLLPPAKATNQPPQVEVGHQQPREVPSALPQVGEEQVIVPGLTGTKWSCTKLVIESPSPKGLPI